MNADITTSKYVIELARDLRKNMTLSEKILWQKLKNKQKVPLRGKKGAFSAGLSRLGETKQI